MAHSSKRVLAIAVLAVLVAVTSVEANPKKKNPNQTWCVAKDNTPENVLSEILNRLCGPQVGVDCSLIQPNAACYYPNTYQNHASFAMDQYYQTKGDCVFNGHGKIVNVFPVNNGGCYHHPDDYESPHGGQKSHSNAGHSGQSHQTSIQDQSSGEQHQRWCVAREDTPNDELQKILDKLCNEINCAPIQAGGKCFLPDDLVHHASWAMNYNYQTKGQNLDECIHSGNGKIVARSPSYGNCLYMPRVKSGSSNEL